MDGYFNLLDWIVMGFGVYALYAAWILKREGKITKTFLVFKDTNMNRCKDLQGYANFMSPKLWTLGVVMIVYSAVSLLNTHVVEIMSLFWVMMAALLAVLAWYAMEAKKALKRYF
ncbi:MAG: hypothetical protein IKV59_09000 [Lachnospiraceae bacterium]|nr:hypothetical protein [Lachnospiraceae bacterium]